MLSRKPDKNACFETSAFTPTTYLKARWRERKRSGGVVCLTWQLVSCQLLLLFWKPNWEVNFSVKSTKMLEHQSLILFSSLTKLRFLDIFNDVELFTKLGILAFFWPFWPLFVIRSALNVTWWKFRTFVCSFTHL